MELERRYGQMFRELRVSSLTKDMEMKVDRQELHAELEKIFQEMQRMQDQLKIVSYNTDHQQAKKKGQAYI